MSCGHGCGRGHHPSHDSDWGSRGDWPDDLRTVRRDRTWSRIDDAPAAEVLEMRLAGLHGAIQRLEAELAEIRDARQAGAVKPMRTRRRIPAACRHAIESSPLLAIASRPTGLGAARRARRGITGRGRYR